MARYPLLRSLGVSSVFTLGTGKHLITRMLKMIDQNSQIRDGIFSVDDACWPLEIKTFGGFSLITQGERLQLTYKTQQKPIELLKALIACGGYEVCEERLSERLWPDAEGDIAHRRYNTTLHRLRRLIGSNAIIVKQGKASLNPECCWLDVWAYQALCDELELMLKDENTAVDEIHHCTEALFSLYQGPFLKNETETTCLLVQREQQRIRLRRTLKMVVIFYSQADCCEYALKLYQKALEIDELSEELYRGVIACYAALGLYSEALAAYENCRQILASIFGIAPNEETNSLYQIVRRKGNNRVGENEIKTYLDFLR